jgi:streptogramin lyase
MKDKATGVRGSPGRKHGLKWISGLAPLAVVWLGACESANPTSMSAPGDVIVHPSYVIASTNYKYTLDGDFDQGTLVNVNHTAPNNNQLQLNTASGTFPFIWIALSQRCTIAKVNTQTGVILGEYRTVADQVGCNQSSRTTVAIDGSVWVGHRGPGGVAHVGLIELNQCVDRNNNGTIETSTAYGDVRPWPGGSPSNVANAQDECILHQVNTDALAFGDSRHVSIDANNKLWVGSFNGLRGFVRVNGQTGAIETAVKPTTCGGYGGLIDNAGIIWSASGGQVGLLRWDPNSPDVPGVNPRCISIPVYGLAIDAAGQIFATDLGSSVRRVSPDGNTIIGPASHGAANAQGLAVDDNGDVWVSSSLFCGGAGCTIGHLKNNLVFVGNVPNPTGAGSTGIAVDAAGKIWSANLNANTATRIDPTAGPIGGAATPIGAVDLTVSFPATTGRPLPFPYNYSDMTGAQLFNSTAPQGSWIVVQDGGLAGTPWGSISWNTEAQGSEPAGTQITVEARAADTQAGLGSQSFVPVTNGTAFSLTGRFIEVRVTLKSAPNGTSPVLSDLSIVSARSDAAPPLCALTATGTDATGKKYIEVTTSDPASGLASIVVTKATNLTAVVPAFSVGQTTPVVVRATKIVQTQGSTLALRVTDVAGNITNCDPVDVTISRTTGKPDTHVFTGLPQAEHWIDVQNESPGLTGIQIKVNGKVFQVAGLKDGELRTLNVSSAMNAGSNNTISLEAQGKPGGSAWVLVRD